ncbi:MAG: hypothetical protein KDI79_31115 [Anaerolineae bacterium]|nr:hypothetical protein [Anaerolineae bacterium]
MLGLWIASRWLTELLFIWVINPLFDDVLERHDGLVILLSGLLWTGVYIGLYFWLVLPEMASSSSVEQAQAFWLFVGIGMAWGVSIGTWILLVWWSKIEPPREPPFEPAQQLGSGLRIESAPSATSQPILPSMAELNRDLDHIFNRSEKEVPVMA